MPEIIVGKPAKKKKEHHGKAELSSECSTVDIKIIELIVYVCWRGEGA